jgi:hypothetical protein
MAIILDDLPLEDSGAELGDGDDVLPDLGGSISWCWDFDFAALLDAVTGPAPWLRATEADGPDEAYKTAGSAAGESVCPIAGRSAGPQAGSGAEPVPTESADREAESSADPVAGEIADPAAEQIADPEADEAAFQEAVEAGRARELPLEFVAGRVSENLPTGPGLAGWLALARAADLEDGALAGVAASFRRLASWAAAGELAAVAQIASRSARTDRRAEVDAAGRPDQVTADAAGQVALALAMSPDGASAWTDLGIVLGWRLRATGAALAAGDIDLSRARMIARVTGPLSDEAARQVEAAVLGRAGWLTLGQLHAALRRAVIKADPEGAERRRRRAERNSAVVLYPEDEGTATLAGYALPGVQAAAAMARITALAKAMQAGGNGGQIDFVRAQVFLGLLLDTLPYIPPSSDAPPDEPPPDEPPPDEPPHGTPPGESGRPPVVPPHERPEQPECGGNFGAEDPAPEPGPDHNGIRGADEFSGPSWPWPGALPYLPPGTGALAGVRPLAGAGGLLNLTVPLGTLTGASSAPGQLSRLGVITPGQARQLANLAAGHSATRWRMVVVNPDGKAIAVTHLPRSSGTGTGTGTGASTGTGSGEDGAIGLIGRVTLVIRTDQLTPAARHDQPAEQRHGPAPPAPPAPSATAALPRILERARAAAGRAAAAAADRRREDEQSGGCGHGLASSAYRPPPRIAELVIARDCTCRFGPCRRPAELCDLDHVVPFDQGGLTCSCNLGGECRSHHRLKQHPGWSVIQPIPGVFRWTTPAGRTYITRPDTYLT